MTPNVVPRCDRCGRSIDPEFLTFDGLGWVCPACRICSEEPQEER